MKSVYFDNAATTPMDTEVMTAMQNALSVYGNPSSLHAAGRKAKAMVEQARKEVAQLIGATAGEIVFTSGGTEADNLAVLGVVATGTIQHLISSPIEHPAVLQSVEAAKKMGVEVHHVRLSQGGEVDMAHLAQLLQSYSNSLVSLMHVNNEAGVVLDIARVSELCQMYGAIFHTDAVQGLGHFSLDMSGLKVDLLSGSAHKIHGPKGVGFLYVRKGTKLRPHLLGGKQERELRGGTENVTGIVGLGKAAQVLHLGFADSNRHIRELKTYFVEQMRSSVPTVRFNGLGANGQLSSPAIVSVNFPDMDSNELLLFQLDLAGVQVSGGSACSSGSLQGSYVLKALGVSGASIRISFSKFNTRAEIDFLVEKITEIVGKE